MKNSIFTLLLMVFVVACEDQQIASKTSLPQTIRDFQASSEFSLVKTNFTSLTNNLSFNDYWRETIEGKEVFAVPSINNKTTTGVIYFDENFNLIIETRALLQDKVMLSFRDLNNSELVSWTGLKQAGGYVFRYDELADNYAKAQINGRLSSCTSDCYGKAKKACESDSECDMWCDLTPGCHVAIAIACFIHCW